MTDANLLLGKIQPAHFPAIFGPAGRSSRSTPQSVRVAFDRPRGGGVERHRPRPQPPLALAEGFVRIAVAHMAGAIREITLRRGHDASRFTLACFGGAGGQHACLVADALGMTRIFIHPLAGVLSAYGMGLADQSVIRTQAMERELDGRRCSPRSTRCAPGWRTAARAELAGQGAAAEAVAVSVTAELRLAGTDAPLPVALATLDAMQGDFGRQHQARFGFAVPDRPLILEALSVEAVAAAAPPEEPALPPRDPALPLAARSTACPSSRRRDA